MRVFRENGISASGKVLSYEDFKLYRDMKDATFDREQMKTIIRDAEKYLSEDIPFLPLSLYREFFINGNRANYEKGYFKRRDMAITLAVAEHYEGQGRFTEKLADVVWAIMEESSWIIPAHTWNSPSRPGTDVPEVYNSDALHGIDLFSAGTGAAMSAIIHYAGDALDTISPIIKEKLELTVNDRLIKPYVNSYFGWMGVFGGRMNNWCPWITCNALYAAALLVKDTKTRTLIVEKAMTSVDCYVDGMPPDGGCDEGPNYWGRAGACLFDCLEIIEDMTGGEITVYHLPIIKNIGEYVAKVNIHADRFVNFADCPGKTVPDGYLIMRYGEKCDSDMLRAFGRIMAPKSFPRAAQAIPYRSIKNLMTPMVTEAPASAAALNTYMPNLKVMVSRQYPDTGVGMFLAIKGGHNAEHHNHNDVGSFVVYHGGEPVLIDVGVGQYTRQTFSPQRYELWFMQSNYHNLPTFGGVGEMQGIEYASRDEKYDPADGSLSLQLAGAFVPEVGVRSFVLHAVMKDGVITVTDDVTLDRPCEIDFHFMTARAPEIISEGKIALPQGRTLSFDPALTPEIEEFESVGLDAESAWGTKNLWRIHLRTTADSFKGEFVIE